MSESGRFHLPMSERCDMCGSAALESEQFAEERLPLWRAKRYCPACRKKFYHRVYVVLAIIPLVFAFLGILDVQSRNIRPLDSTALWVAFLIIVQWLMIFPHDLGHAGLARL